MTVEQRLELCRQAIVDLRARVAQLEQQNGSGRREVTNRMYLMKGGKPVRRKEYPT